MKTKEFGKYLLTAKLGSGGMADVYKAHAAGHPDKFLAIKKILPQYAKNKQLVGMLVNEAKVTFGLDHPNIVPVIDFGMIDGTYFLAMEYIYGKDLKTIFLQLQNLKKELPIPFALFIMSSVLKGLDYAHHKSDPYGQALQIVHRDISPQNVVISFSGQVKILDFGIAISTAKFDPSELGILKGKFSYMSPEQAYGKEVDPRSDIYSAGIVLWELLTMQSCFVGNNEVEVLNDVREAATTPVHLKNPKVTLELSQIVMKSLDKRVHARYATAGEFAQKLDRYLLDRFGSVSQADIAAFLRTIFKVNAEEMGPDPVMIEAKAVKNRKDHTKTLSEILYAEDLKSEEYVTPYQPAPWTKKKSSIWSWDLLMIPAGILVVGLLFTSLPIKDFLDTSVDYFKTLKNGQAPPEKIFTHENTYTVELSPDAQKVLQKMPFESFESVKNLIFDLGKNPRPGYAKQKEPGSVEWSMLIQRHTITYEVLEDSKTVFIKKIGS